jgi:hypothetical protein
MRTSYPPTLEIVGDLRPGGFPKYSPAFSDVSNADPSRSLPVADCSPSDLCLPPCSA